MKRILVILLITALVAALCAYVSKDEDAAEIPNPASTADSDMAAGSTSFSYTVTFGAYEQDNDLTNGSEPIEWIVLNKNDRGELLLISKYGLDAVPYNRAHIDRTWEKSTIRTWLNREFCNSAFSADDQERILTAHVTADKNPSYDTDPGNDTEDKVFLLSITEARKYLGSDNAGMCVPTKRAIANGVWVSDSYNVNGEATCLWWLRSAGSVQNYAANVYFGGYVLDYGSLISSRDICVRPAMWVRLVF